MQLSYRGLPYNTATTVETIPGEIMGQYRGAAIRHTIQPAMPAARVIAQLSYRGASYNSPC
ncbi:MAG TPA: DUF4278 domain-containing protein [Chroococcidiopsis sp.]